MTITPSRAVASRIKRVRRSGTTQRPEVERRLAAAAELQATIQRLETELSAHRTWLLDHLTATNQRNVTLGNGFTAHLRVRHNFEYSPKLANEMLHIKAMQKLEQQDGIAVDRPTPYVALVFKPAKEG